MNTSKVIDSALALLAVSGMTTAAIGQAPLPPLAETIVTQGDAAIAANVTYSIINVADLTNDANIPAVNGNRQVVFRSDLAGAGTATGTNVGLFGGAISAPALIAREGSTAAGQPAGVNWSDFSTARISDAGTISFTATLVGAGVGAANNEGIWRGPVAGPLSIVALRGTNAGITGVPAAVFSDLFAESVRLNETNDLIFFASLTGAGVPVAADRGLWYSSPAGVLSIVAVENDQAPGVPAGVLFSDFTDPSGTDVSSLVLGGSRAAWISTLRGTGVTTSNDLAAFTRDIATGTNSLLVREGDSAAGLITGAVWGSPGSISVGANNTVVIRSALTGVPAASNVVVTKWVGATPSIVVQKGDPAPILTGLTFSDILSSANLAPKVNASGGVAFLGVLAGTGVVTGNNQLLCYRPDGGTVVPVLRKGTQIPGAAPGTVVNVINSFALNALGHIIIQCTVTGGGATTATDNTILAYIPGQPLRVITREGDVVNVDPNVTRTMNATSITLTPQSTTLRNNSGGSDGQRTGLGSDGTFVYRGYFTDGSSRLLAIDAATFPCSNSDVSGPGQAVGYDGSLTADDIIVFLNWFFASDLRADVAGPGQSTIPDTQFTADDIIVFLNRFFSGC